MDVRLVMFREDGSSREFPINPGVTTIGRKDDCGIRIPLAEVSRHHGEILMDGHTALLRDLGAANGTYLNDQRVEEEELEAGDRIRIGPIIFVVQIEGEPESEELRAIHRKASAQRVAGRAPSVATSKHVYISDEEVDPIAALEALASSADQTAINPEDED